MKHTVAPHVYIVGRNASEAERIIGECKTLNADGRVEFLKADVSELSEVDRICAEIKKKESELNLVVQTQGNLNLRGRDGSSPSRSISNYPVERDGLFLLTTMNIQKTQMDWIRSSH